MRLLTRARIFTSVALVFSLLLGGVCVVSFQQLERSQSSVDDMLSLWNEISQLRAAGLEYTVGGTERAYQQTGLKLARLDELINQNWVDAAATNESAGEGKFRRDLRRALLDTRDAFAQFPERAQTQTRSARDQRTLYLFNQSILRMTTSMVALQQEANAANDAAVRTVKWVTLAFVGLLSGTAIFLSLWLRRQILLPIGALHADATAIAAGDHTAVHRLLLDRTDELGDLSKALSKAVLDLEESNRDLEGFSYSVSHDLRAPLRAIDGFVSILQRSHVHQLNAEGQRLFGVVSGNARRMGLLIDDILEVSRAGRMELQNSRVDMNQMVREVWAELRAEDASAASQGEAPVETVSEPQLECAALPPAYCDPRAIRQVWKNLLSNARKFSRVRSPAIIQVTGVDELEFVRYCVKDNGVGFNQAYVDKLFTLFQRLHGMHEFAGTGVGLAIVKRFVRKHGGQVEAQGVLNQGASFSFTLPKAR